MMITILSHAEVIKAVIERDDNYEITATYFRRTTGGRWTRLRKTTVAGPLHLALNTVHAVVNGQ